VRKEPDVSIIVVSWNTREILRDCLRSIYEQAGDVSFEIIVVDNGSTDGSAEMVAARFTAVQLIANPENRGFAAANNQGMALARGRYVLLLNSDTIVLNGAIAKSVAFADAHVGAAVVGCRVWNAERVVQNSCFLFPSALNLMLFATYGYKLFPKSRFWGREMMTYWDHREVRPVDVVSGCYMLVRRAVIEQVGMMDEAFFIYAEETDWCYRFRQAGWQVLFFPAASIIHLGGASSCQVEAQMKLQAAGGILYFLKKHQSRWEYTCGCFFMALFFLIRLPLWWGRGGLLPHARAFVARRANVRGRGARRLRRLSRPLCRPARERTPRGAGAPAAGPGGPINAGLSSCA